MDADPEATAAFRAALVNHVNAKRVSKTVAVAVQKLEAELAQLHPALAVDLATVTLPEMLARLQQGLQAAKIMSKLAQAYSALGVAIMREAEALQAVSASALAAISQVDAEPSP